MGGSSAPSGETKYNWNEDMAPRWNSLLNTAPWAGGFQMNEQGNVVGIKPREMYTGERYAPQVYDQMAYGSHMRAMNEQSSPIPAMEAARGQIEDTLGGNYLGRNPYAVASDNPYIGGNQFQDQNTFTNRNLFAGDNPYLRGMVQTGMEDITNAYKQGTSADTTRMFNLAGAFGGSAHQNAVANNEAALGKSLNSFADSMLNQQFNRSAGLEDSFLSRDISNQQFNKNLASGIREAELGRGFENYTSGLDRGFTGYENERNRMMGAIGAGQNEQGLALDRGQAQFNYGSFLQNMDQQNRDFQFDQWNQQQNHPFTMMNWLSGLYGNAQGGMGPNMQVYQGGSSQYAPWLGAALAGASFLG